MNSEKLTTKYTDTPETKIKLKSYRITNYDEYDKEYATRMKYMYQNIETGIKDKFDIFTEKLIDDDYISRNSLLDAIRDFTKKNDDIENYISWVNFTNEAFNYRPYQSCCIS